MSKDAANPDRSRAVESVSPDPPLRATGPSHRRNDKSPDIFQPTNPGNVSSRDVSARATKDPERQAGNSPGSSKYQSVFMLSPWAMCQP